VRASLRAAELLEHRGESSDALTILDQAISELDGSGESEARNWAQLMLVKAERLWAAQDGAEALVALDSVVERLDHAGDLETRKLVASALLLKAFIFGSMQRELEAERVTELLLQEFAEPALAALDDRIADLAGATDPPLRSRLGQALLSKAVLLQGVDREEETETIRERLISEFEHDDDPTLVAIAAAAQELL
jgi:hypothetical protein